MSINPDRSLLIAQAVEPNPANPGHITLDLIEHQIVEKTPQEWSRMVGRLRFWSKFDRGMMGVFAISGVAFLGGAVYRAYYGHYLDGGILLGLIPSSLKLSRYLLNRSKNLSEGAEAIEQTVNTRLASTLNSQG